MATKYVQLAIADADESYTPGEITVRVFGPSDPGRKLVRLRDGLMAENAVLDDGTPVRDCETAILWLLDAAARTASQTSAGAVDYVPVLEPGP